MFDVAEVEKPKVRALDDAAVLDAIAGAVTRERPARPSEALGLGAADFDGLATLLGAARWPPLLPRDEGPVAPIDEIEDDLVALLVGGATPGDEAALPFARVIARRALEDGHLYVAMGLDVRADLTAFMRRRFPQLAVRNDGTMRWKKFLYRELCAAEGAILCKSPRCADCVDRTECFV